MRFSTRASGLTGSAIREIFRHTARPGIISFAGGNPGSFALPAAQVAQIAHRLLQQQGATLLQYGQTQGYLPLRESLLPYVETTFGVRAALEEVLVTTGSMQGLDLLCRAFLDDGDVVLVESPCFLGALQAFRANGARLVPIPCDEQGMIPETLEKLLVAHRPKLVYAIPTFQNPTGTTLPRPRRQRIAQLVAQHDALLVEDDPYHELRYEGQELPSIKSFDGGKHVALLGSFSKVISPGLRVGFMIAHPQIVERCQILKQCTDVHTANLNQAIVDAFLREDLLSEHVRSILPPYAQALERMLAGLETIPQIASFTKPEGGLFLFAALVPQLDAGALFRLCIGRGLAFVPGEPFYAEAPHKNTMRLNFSNASLEQIDQGLRILAECATALT